MGEPIRPALSPEEWADNERDRLGDAEPEDVFAYEYDGVSYVGIAHTNHDSESVATPGSRHALAALCLDGQPFGFTWEDVDALRRASTSAIGKAAYRINDIADRLSALLRPREEKP